MLPQVLVVSRDRQVGLVSLEAIDSWGCKTHLHVPGSTMENGNTELVLIDGRIGPDETLATLQGLRRDESLCGIPAIVIYPDGEEIRARAFMFAGADDCLPASETAEHLRPTIEARLARFRSISARLKAEQSLRESEVILRSVVDHAEEAICLLDHDGRELWCNPSFSQLMPVTAPCDEPARLASRLHGSDRPGLSIALERAQTTGRSGTFEYRTLNAAGNIRHFEANVCAISNPSVRPGRLIVIARDVTPRKHEEHSRTMTRILLDEAQRLESIGRLSSGIAHEINTPTQFVGDNLRFLRSAFTDLETIADRIRSLVTEAADASRETVDLAALSEALESCDLSYLRQEIPSALEQSSDGVQRVAGIVGAMREFSHPSSPDKAPADLNRALESTCVVARNEWKYVADLEFDLDPHLGEICCSIGELNQVFLNLIVNAAHAIAEKIGENASGKGTIHISTHRAAQHAEVRVKDSGTGISPEVQRHLFEPFFTTKPVGKGTGQGLAIARSVVVDRHGGEITYETTPGEGTCFTLRIPVQPTEKINAA